MKLQKNLLISFLILSIFFAIFGVITIYQVNEMTYPLSTEIPNSITSLIALSNVDNHAQNIRYYDEVLTQSARNFVFTQDIIWSERYDETVILLDNEIEQSILRGTPTDKSFFVDIDFANQKLVEMETNAFFFVRNGDSEKAISILESQEYANFKALYSKSLENYAEMHGVTRDVALTSTEHDIAILTNDTQHRINFGLFAIVISFTVLTISSILYGLIISKKIIAPINKLGIAAKKITDGKLDVVLPEDGFDESRELSQSFNTMSKSLKKTIELEKKLAIAETQLKSERFAAIGEASSKIAHDLRNPLTKIKAELELFHHFNHANLDEKSLNRILAIDKSIDFMDDQIQGMLNYVKTNQLDLVTTTVSNLTSFVIQTVVKPDNIDIELPRNDFTLKCDLQKLTLVLTNLINNGMQAVGIQQGTISLTFEETSNHVMINVIDSGPGISDSLLDKIFEPLYTTKKTGTGLGLSSCKNIIEYHGGVIQVKNNPTTFTIMLPKDVEQLKEKITLHS